MKTSHFAGSAVFLILILGFALATPAIPYDVQDTYPPANPFFCSQYRNQTFNLSSGFFPTSIDVLAVGGGSTGTLHIELGRTSDGAILANSSDQTVPAFSGASIYNFPLIVSENLTKNTTYGAYFIKWVCSLTQTYLTTKAPLFGPDAYPGGACDYNRAYPPGTIQSDVVATLYGEDIPVTYQPTYRTGDFVAIIFDGLGSIGAFFVSFAALIFIGIGYLWVKGRPKP